MTPSRRALLSTVAAGLAGCGATAPAPRGDATASPESPPPGATYAYTHLQATGNRVLDGGGDLAGAAPVDIPVEGTPAWLLASPADPGSYWTVVTEDGRARTHRVLDGTREAVADHGRVRRPPLGVLAGGEVGLVTPPADCAAHTHPVPLPDGWLYVAADGDLVAARSGSRTRLDARAPADARPVALGGGRYALYGGRTDRYRHGALGDTVEGSSLLVVDGRPRAAASVDLAAPAVFEGLAPLAADLDGDGRRELVTTVATAADGARVRAYDPDGAALATGPVYGPGWRHQLCVAPFGPDGRPELAVVRKPHVDRTLEFYRLVDGDLAVAATREGYASHVYGSRVLDGALAADLDGDGRPELLVPSADRTTLEAVRRVAGGTARAFALPLGGSLATNLNGTTLAGGVAVGAATAAGVRVWQG